jgi:hypothetical protein
MARLLVRLFLLEIYLTDVDPSFGVSADPATKPRASYLLTVIAQI